MINMNYNLNLARRDHLVGCRLHSMIVIKLIFFLCILNVRHFLPYVVINYNLFLNENH